MARVYGQLHAIGHAHSIEVWQGDMLVGGLYGVSLGGFFAGESMFHRARDASKVALVVLVAHLRARGFRLFDVQQATAHAVSMGATEIRRSRFVARLREALDAAGHVRHCIGPVTTCRDRCDLGDGTCIVTQPAVVGDKSLSSEI